MRIGVDLGGTKIEVIVLADTGAELKRARAAAPQNDYKATLHAIKSLIDQVEEQVAADVKRASVGVGIPGTLSPQTGLVKNANSTWLIGHPLDQDLTDLLARPVKIANDANCFALSEAADGAGAGAESVFGVILGTGVGGGLVIRGEILEGPNSIAGEWGHNPLPWPNQADSKNEIPGPACYCGLSGCIETFLSGAGLKRCFEEILGTEDHNGHTAKKIHEFALQGDKSATASLDLYANRLARALASVINTVDPEIIVLGGGLSNINYLYERIPQLWTQWVFSDDVTTRLMPNKHGDSSGVRGAAWLWPVSTGASG